MADRTPDPNQAPDRPPVATAERPAVDPKLRSLADPPATGQNLAVRRDDTMAIAFQGLVPSSIGEAMMLSQHLAKGKAVPKSLQGEPENIFTIILAGIEIGLTPIRAIQSISIISGSLAMKADLQLAQVRRSGALDFYDEGFELKGDTDADGNLERRLEKRPDEAVKILDLTEAVPDGKPYGWAISRRKGDPQYHVRVFTWLDAERFKYSEWEGEGQARGKVDKKLSEKAAYVNTPQDMYPKRARVRVLQVTHSDVLAGMPAIEALDGVTIDGEVVRSEAVQPTSNEDTIDQLVAIIRERDAVQASSILAGFEQLQLGIAKRLQLLRQFQGNGTGLLDWLKTEYSNRQTKGQGRRKPDVLGETVPAAGETKLAPAAPKPPAAATKPAPAETKQPLDSRAHAGDGDTAAQEASAKPKPPNGAQPMESLKSIADRFKSNLPSF